MSGLRIGAVGYLNTLPLVHGLDAVPGRFAVRFDVPSRCAELLHAGEIDLGLIPSIALASGDDYRVVPGVAIASNGPVASVAVFSSKPLASIGSIALDTSSRTSVALLRVLCRERFGIAPRLEADAPSLDDMLRRCDAALLIGDPALFADHAARGLLKIDLGEEWTALTGLPFVWAFWAGRPSVVTADVCRALADARDRGVAAVDEIASTYAAGDEARERVAAHYLRHHISYGLGPAHEAALERYYTWAAALGIGPPGTRPVFGPR
jgi:chorismate dehydratase